MSNSKALPTSYILWGVWSPIPLGQSYGWFNGLTELHYHCVEFAGKWFCLRGLPCKLFRLDAVRKPYTTIVT